jgi:glycogen(starch) synthase
MKICLVNKSYLDETWDGISAYTHYLAKGLSEYGHEVHIITRFGTNNHQQNERQGKIWVHKVKLFRKLEKLNDLLFPLKAYFKFREINKKYEIDIVEAPEAGAEGFWLSIFARKKLVTRLHTPLYLYWEFNELKLNWGRRLLNFMEKTQAKRSALLSSPTQALAKIVTKMWRIKKEQIEFIPNPINLDKDKNYQKIKDKDYLLYLGRIEKLKGIEILLKALKIALKKYPHLKILFVGGMDSSLYNKNQLKKLSFKIEKNLVFLGDLEYNKVFPYLKRAKLVVLPSLWENLPYTLLESLALGKLVVASNCGGFKEIIEDGKNGFLFKTGSHYGLAQKIIECLNLEENKIKIIEKNAQKTVREFSLKRVIPKIVKFYSRAI